MLNNRYLSFKLKSEAYTEHINEFFIVIMLYHLLVFNDSDSSQLAKNYVGWSMMGVMLLNMIFNFTLIFISKIGQLYKALRTRYFTWKRDRLLQKIQDQDEFSDPEPDFKLNDGEQLQSEENKIEQRLLKRDLTWYKNVTFFQAHSPESGGDF